MDTLTHTDALQIKALADQIFEALNAWDTTSEVDWAKAEELMFALRRDLWYVIKGEWADEIRECRSIACRYLGRDDDEWDSGDVCENLSAIASTLQSIANAINPSL